MPTLKSLSDLAPLGVLLITLLGAIGSLLRYRGVHRLRSTMAKDVQLWAGMPTGEAKDLLESVLVKEAATLKARVVDGIQPSRLRFFFFLSLTYFVTGLITSLLAEAMKRLDDTNSDAFVSVYFILGKVFATVGLIAMMACFVMWAARFVQSYARSAGIESPRIARLADRLATRFR